MVVLYSLEYILLKERACIANKNFKTVYCFLKDRDRENIFSIVW